MVKDRAVGDHVVYPDVDTAGFQTFGSGLAATGGTKVFDSQDGVVIRATSQDTAIADGDDLVGYLLYVVD